MRFFSKYLTLSVLSVIVLLTTHSCQDDDDEIKIRIWHPSTDYKHLIEVPALVSSNIFIHHSTVYEGDSMMNYCLEYNTAAFHSRWVAFRFDGATRSVDSERRNIWKDDPNLASQYRIGTGYFSGKERGHLCASHDRRYSQEANDQTFYMTNISPMYGSFNEKYWLAYEGLVQTKGRSASFADTLYVTKGGTITADKILGYCKSGANKNMVIPKYYFIALLAVKGSTYKAIGFWVEHKDYGYNTTPTDAQIRSSAMSIDDLETKTGIDFFHNLSDDIENEVEAKYNYNDWK